MPLTYNPWAGLYTRPSPEQQRAESASSFADALTESWAEGGASYARSLARQKARAELDAFKFAQAQKEASEVESNLDPGTASVLAEYGLTGGATPSRKGSRGGSRGGGAGGGGVDPIAFSEAQEELHRRAREREEALRRAGELTQRSYDEHEQNILFNDPVAAIEAQKLADQKQEIYERNRDIEWAVRGIGRGGEYWNPEGMAPGVKQRVDEILSAKRRGANVGLEAEEFLRRSLAGKGRVQRTPVYRQQGLVPGAGPAVGTLGVPTERELAEAVRALRAPPAEASSEYVRPTGLGREEFPGSRGRKAADYAPTMTVGGVESPLTRALREPVQDIGVGSEDMTAVRSVQNFLKGAGHKGKNNRDIVVDGDFGGNTVHALKQFQKSEGISETGVVDAATRSAMAGAETPSRLKKEALPYLTDRQRMKVDLHPGVDYPASDFRAKKPEPVRVEMRPSDKGAAERRATAATSRALSMPEGRRNPLTEALGLDPGVVYSPKKIGRMITMAKRGHKDSLNQLAQMGVDPNDLDSLSGDMMEFQLEAAKLTQESQSAGDLDTAEWGALVTGYASSLSDLGMPQAELEKLSEDMATVALTRPERAKEIMRALDQAMRRGGAREQAAARMELQDEIRKTAATVRRKVSFTKSGTDEEKKYQIASDEVDSFQDNLTNAEKRFDDWKNSRRDPAARRYRLIMKRLPELEEGSEEHKALKLELEELVEPFVQERTSIRDDLDKARDTLKHYRNRLPGQTTPTDKQIKAAKKKAAAEKAEKRAVAAKVVSGALSDDEAADKADEVSLNDLIRAMKKKKRPQRVGPPAPPSNEEIADFLSGAPAFRDRQEVLEALARLE